MGVINRETRLPPAPPPLVMDMIISSLSILCHFFVCGCDICFYSLKAEQNLMNLALHALNDSGLYEWDTILMRGDIPKRQF